MARMPDCDQVVISEVETKIIGGSGSKTGSVSGTKPLLFKFTTLDPCEYWEQSGNS